MYACSPGWKADWLPIEDARKILTWLSECFKSRYPPGLSRVIGVNWGLHFTGGEPFLNFNLLLELVRLAGELGIPSTFVETNCFWCNSDGVVEERFKALREAGLHGVLVSVNPFIVERVPFENLERAISVGREIFGGNLLIYHELFYEQLRSLGIRGTLSFEEYLSLMAERQPQSLAAALSFPSLLPMGRIPYKLGHLYRHYPASRFFHESCRSEIVREWHIHIDNYGNYVAGYCGGLTFGDARKPESLLKGLDLNEHPVIKALISPGGLGLLYKLAEKHGYREKPEGYISKCHLCVDLRRHLAAHGAFKELKPLGFYEHLED